MKSAILMLTCLCIFSLAGCKKDNDSSAELTAKQLKTVISENGIKRVLALEAGQPAPSVIFSDYGKKYSFQNGFITVTSGTDDISYNLDLLSNYEVKTVTVTAGTNTEAGEEKVLLLTFK